MNGSEFNEDSGAMLANCLYNALGLVALRRRFGRMVVLVRIGRAVIVGLLGLLKKVVDAVRLGAGESNHEKR
jgi:hypothetical protein